MSRQRESIPAGMLFRGPPFATIVHNAAIFFFTGYTCKPQNSSHYPWLNTFKQWKGCGTRFVGTRQIAFCHLRGMRMFWMPARRHWIAAQTPPVRGLT